MNHVLHPRNQHFCWGAFVRLFVSGLLLTLLGLTTLQAQTIRYVKQGGSGNGTSWAAASGNLQVMINASGVEQVWVAAGTYKPTTGTDRTISFSMRNGVSILGGFPASGTPALSDRQPQKYSSVLSGEIGSPEPGDNSYHIIHNAENGLDATAILNGFTITGGNANGNVVNRETDSWGGGMLNLNSSPQIINCSFIGNSAGNGGGIYNLDNSSQIVNCSFIGNSASVQGGGIINLRSSPTLINCLLVLNQANIVGGAIYNFSDSTPQLINCTLSQNRATYEGGAIFNVFASAGLTNCILWDNGGGNALRGDPVSANFCLMEAEMFSYEGLNNLTATVSPFISPTNYQLNACSPAIDAGNNGANSATTDLAGNPRKLRTIDMGAYEFQGTPTPPVTITSQPPSGSAVCTGSNVSVSVVATGSSPLMYQWFKDGNPFSPPQTTATLNLTNVQPTDVGNYSVVITNTCGPVTSTAFSLSVTNPSPPTLTPSATTTNQPISVTATGCAGTLNWLPQGGVGQAMGNIYTFSQPGNYTLSATCQVVSCISLAAPTLTLSILPAGFAITAVTMVNCQLTHASSGEYRVSFSPRYSGQNSNPISFSVVNEKLPTTDPAPYSLRLYSDNPTITLVANQSGNAEAQYRFNWLAACQSGTDPNQAPTTTGIPSQTLVQDQGYALALTNYFADPDGQALTFSAQGLPAGLSLSGSQISGAPSATGVSTISITALDPGGLLASTSFQLRVTPRPAMPSGFTLTGVSTVSCEVVSAGERRLTFTPQYAGVTGQPISFSVVNEKLPTTDAGPYSLNLYTDNPIITLSARQGSSEAQFVYHWLSACNGNARRGSAEGGRGLQVRVLGNPVTGSSVEVEISGVAGQAVAVALVDLQGRPLHQQRIAQAGSTERVRVPVGAGGGLLRVSTATQVQTLKVVKL